MGWASGVLGQLLAGESERIEWKESDADAGETLRAVCAMANDLGDTKQPGFVVLGIDKLGRSAGVDTSDESTRRLADRLSSTKILPHPSTDVDVASHEGRGVLVVRVQPYPVPPVVKVDGVAWIRRGTTTRRASDVDLQRLVERRPENALPFDTRPWPHAGLDDLDLTRLRDAYRAERDGDADVESYPSFEPWLGLREIARQVDGMWVPTVAGLLVHGADPQTFFRGAVVEFARFGGVEFDAPVTTRKTAAGGLSGQIETIWAQIQAHLAEVPSGSVGIQATFSPQYPLEALKELVRNIVQHRAYEATNAPARVSWLDDRIVFSNPGRPYGQASQGPFGEHSDYRNPLVTSMLRDLGYVQRLGRGVRLARAQLRKNGNPDLEVETDGFTTVTVRRRP